MSFGFGFGLHMGRRAYALGEAPPPPPPPPPPPTALVVLLAGQSNMIGRAADDGGPGFPDGVRQYRQDGTLAPAVDPLDHVSAAAGDIGMAGAFARGLLADTPDADLVFVPAARSGTGFSNGQWSQGDPAYDSAVARTNAALTAANGALAGILWHQGERDATGDYADAASEHAAALDGMIGALRSDITGAGAAPVVVGEIGRFLGTGGFPDRDAVNAAITGLPARVAGTSVVASGGLTQEDGVHFDAASQRRLGYLYYERWKGSAQLLPNGDFYADDLWVNVRGGWAISDGMARHDSSGQDNADFETDFFIGDGPTSVDIEIKVSGMTASGAASLIFTIVGIAGVQISGITADGVYTATATGSGWLKARLRKETTDPLVANVEYLRITPQ